MDMNGVMHDISNESDVFMFGETLTCMYCIASCITSFYCHM